jgi:NitT/TauT family transport system ATP-binding protein
MSTLTNDAPAALTFQDIHLSFDKRDGSRLDVLGGVDFQVKAGEFVCVVGPSGCGKSTLLRLADGLLKPSRGQALLYGERIGKPSPRTSMVFQDDLLLPWRTVMSNVLLPLEFQRAITPAGREFASELLRVVGLADFADAYPSELSGGMRQRANLARGLVSDPDILLLDEPFSALDAQTREVMQEELLRIWRRFQKTVMFITHQIDEAIYLADRVIVLSGRPSGIADVVDVDFARPRPLSIKRDPEFLELTDRVWRCVMDGKHEEAKR